MHYVYLLQCKNGDIYTGRSDDLRRRISEHHAGKVTSTQHLRPLTLLHYEAFLAKEDSIRREKYLKTSTGKRMVKLMLRVALTK